MSNWVFITGGAKRIGRAIALEMARSGWDVIIHYQSSAEAAQGLAKEIEALDSFACLVEMDLAQSAAVERLIPSLVEELGPIGALVNNASLFEPDSADADGARHRAVNLTAPRLLSESFHRARDVAAEAPPVIVNLLDADPTKPQFNSYNRSKIELAALTRSMAGAFAPDIRVNGVALGPVLVGARESQEHFDQLLQATPLQQAIAPQDVAAAVRFLIETPSITGAVIPVDGGAHLKNA